MQSKSFSKFNNTKLKAKKIVYTIWDGPGKFFIVIFISMFIVGIHESMKSIKHDSKFNVKSSFSSNSHLVFTTNNKENKIDMVEIIKKNQHKVQNDEEEENLSVLLEMANQQMESERRRLNSEENMNSNGNRDRNYEETAKNDQDAEILEQIIRDDAIYMNI